MKIKRIIPINIEWNCWNGFIFSLLNIEYLTKTQGKEGELFGIHFSKEFLILNILFYEFEIIKGEW